MPFTQDLPFLIRSTQADSFLRFNESFAEKVGYTREELAAQPIEFWIAEKDHESLKELLAGAKESCHIHHKTLTGDEVELCFRVSQNDEGECVLLARVESPGESSIKQDSSPAEANVKSTLHEIANILEEQSPGYKCSILLVEDGRFVKGAGPSLPEDYNNAIDGFAVGPTVGSCGTAIYWNVPVIVNNIQADPLWAPFAELAQKAGVHACWSHPFTSKSGRVLGALAFYSPEPRKPNAEQLQKLRAAAAMTGLAVERGRAEEALREKHNRTLELEEQLRQAAKMEALGVLAGGVAHDFNNVLNTILTNAEYSQMVLQDISEQNAKKQINERLDDVVSACIRAGNFCNQMLSYAGQGDMKTKTIEIGSLVSELDSLVHAALSKKTVLEFDLSNEPIHVDGDENQLLQVVMNLVTNAAEALKETAGRIVVSSNVQELSTHELGQMAPEDDLPGGSYVCISVQDNGPGIPEQIKARIFDPFFTTKSTGRGLGLSAVQGIIKKHGGVIAIDSEVAKGTTFTVLLPLSQQKANSPDKVQHEELKLTAKNILVADDESSLLEIFKKTFEYKGYQVTTAKDGQQAFELFKLDPQAFDCILLDLSMPKLNGKEVATKIHELNAEVPMILLSGYNETTVKKDKFDASILAATVQKPVKAMDLLQIINKSIEQSNRWQKAS